MPNIPQKDANLILRQSAKFPQKGDQCNASCAFYFCCANSKDFGTCEQGFQLINGDSRKLLERNLGADSVKYIENSYGFIQRAIQNENLEGVELVTRDLSRLHEKAFPEPTQRPSGISYMAQCAFGNQNTQPENTQPETHSDSEFTRMLEASGKGSTNREESHTAISKTTIRMTGMLRMVDETQFPQFCDPEKCPKDFARHCSANRPEHHGKVCIYIVPRNR